VDTQSDEWIIDSGASRHMTFQINVLDDCGSEAAALKEEARKFEILTGIKIYD